ncbi:MAG: MFS transporter, partial [Nanoarchaeota archaeon]|nr:MFS transporter [Nanoarchaeota archaeon]
MNKKEVEKLKKKTLKLSIKEGSYSSLTSGFGNNYITPFALALNSSNLQIGFISSFVSLISPLSQIYGSKLMEKQNRKNIIIKFVFLQALMWLPILSLIFFFWKDIGREYLPYALIFFYLLLTLLGSIATPPWFSLMGDLVPENKRGIYFSIRNRINGAVALISALAAAFILDFFKTKGFALIGFTILFSIAIFGRLKAVALFKKHYEPKLSLGKRYYFSFTDFLKKGTKTNFGKFVIYASFFYFSVMIASPFFAVYMLKDLNFNYKMFMLISMSATIYSLIFITLIGKLSNKFGNKNMLKLSTIFISLTPLLWLFSRNIFYLLFFTELISGIGWATFNLSSNNFIYDSVRPNHRGLCIAYYNILLGVGMFAGAMIGGFLTQYVPINFMNKFLFVFLISSVLRALVGFVFIPRIKEARKIEKMPQFNLSMLNPAPEIRNNLVWIEREIKKAEREVEDGLDGFNKNWIWNIYKKD